MKAINWSTKLVNQFFMKFIRSFILFSFTYFLSCTPQINSEILVSTQEELDEAIVNSKPGDIIVLKNGNYLNLNIQLKSSGEKDNPIILKAETEGEVVISGTSSLKFGGDYIIVKDLHFKDGYSPSDAVIEFRLDKSNIANHCSVINCVIEDFNKLHRDDSDRWVQFWGTHNTLKNCYIAGKTNRGPTIRVDLKGNEHINNYHNIIGNHFGPRPPKGGPSGETIQIGDSYTSMSPSYTVVSNNLFEECNGEVEIISSKTNFNVFKNNVFYKSEGSLVTRHGNYCTIDGNYFIGDGNNKNIGGIRLINTGHWVTNNYFLNLKGESFRSPLAVMNGIPKSPQNRYNQVTDVVVAYNTYVNCTAPWQFGVGTNISQKDVLPKSEIRSAKPIRTLVANNVVYNDVGDKTVVLEHDKADGVTFKANIINNQGVPFNAFNGIIPQTFPLVEVSSNLFIPYTDFDVKPFTGFGFKRITEDIFGNSRNNEDNTIGAVISLDKNIPSLLDKTKYGTSWYSNEKKSYEPKIINVNNSKSLQIALAEAQSEDIILLSAGEYFINETLSINKKLTLKSNNLGETILNYKGAPNTTLIRLEPKGFLSVENLIFRGEQNQLAFSSLEKNMFTHFGLDVKSCHIENFGYALKVYKEAFAERITFSSTSILNCLNGIELSEEINDKGDYNTEYLTLDNCVFKNIKKNVVDYYRGGYDESTIGGNLLVKQSSFINCGALEPNKILINHRGIINVNIENNTFKNNPVALVALLWGAKNNNEVNNTVINSGEFRKEQNLTLKIIY